MAGETIARYPLCWPPGRPRTPPGDRTRARFHTLVRSAAGGGGAYLPTRKEGVSLARARDELFAELDRLGAGAVVLSTNVRLRADGLPAGGQAQPADPGAAVYFAHAGRDMSFANDRWDRVEDNIRAIAKTIEALRGIERWGTGEMVRAAFTGFLALPAAHAADPPWWVVLGVQSHTPSADVAEAYKRLVLKHHPDREGDHDTMAAVNRAYEKFKRERGL